MKKISLFLTLLVLTCSLASASFVVGNFSIDSTYAPGESLKGWINISLQEESTTSTLSAFDSGIILMDFLKNNSLTQDNDFNCFPNDCKTNYVGINKTTSKSDTLIFGNKKILGVMVKGQINSIDSFTITFQSSAQEAEYPQLAIDIKNDGTLDWRAKNFSGHYGSPRYNCYSLEQATQIAEITANNEYCQKMNISYTPKVKVGADVIALPGKGGTVKFNIKMDGESCTATATGSGNISCEIDTNIEEEKEVSVCISAEREEDSNKYGMYYEQNAACGYSQSDDEYTYDFPIFIQRGMYMPIGNLVINEDNLHDEIMDYIEDRYDSNCSKGCIIPIGIISGATQTITVSNMQLGYTSGISTTETYLYDLSEEQAKINMGFKKLDLSKGNFTVPTVYGKRAMTLRLDGTGLASKNIEVLKLSTITQVYPLIAAAAVSTNFYVSASGNVTEYRWNFGDGTEIKTKSNFSSHTYLKTGTYKLKVSAVNSIGEYPREFDIIVSSPKNEINRTIKEKRDNLKNVTNAINKISGWVKEELEKEVNISLISKELDSIESRYTAAKESEDYLEIMKDLQEITVPLEITSVKFSSKFVPFPESVDPSYLPGYKEEDSKNYPDRIIVWIVENLDLNIDSEIIYLRENNEKVPLFTAVTLKVTPKEKINEAFLIVKGEDIREKEDYGKESLEGAIKIELSDFEEEKIFGFILKGGIEAIDLPVYVSPGISKLPGEVVIAPCDNDKICEKDRGETAEECPNDCRKVNWLWITILFFMLIFGIFTIYILLQEWYKRNYENHLFKNKNDLYNLMSFIFNALRQGKEKGEIFKTLRKYKWKDEQITYAFKKLLGKRTGMWEIPLFIGFEKKKVKEELARRGQIYS